jgi:hypothetical protein
LRIANKHLSRKAIAWILAAAALLTMTVGITVAYLMAQTPSLANTFTPVAVKCEVLENFNTASNVKDNVKVKNTGDIPAYIRASIVINWVSGSGSIYGGSPLLDEHYTVTLGANGWFRGTDGFYYYQSPVAAGDVTTNLIEIIQPVTGTAPEGYTLSVQILASAIQAEPANAVTSVWSAVTVNSDGTLSS